MQVVRNSLKFKKKYLLTIAVVIGMIIWTITQKDYMYLTAALLGGSIVICVIVWLEVNLKIKKRKANFPKKGRATMADVKRLALSGYTELAISAYYEIYSKAVTSSDDVATLMDKAKKEVGKIIAESRDQDK
ncbi:MAG: hypothetical protein GY705_17935 [Bacteroidetes bacterium]|nr:hypothetical protein [Bacteroidota bacterium]